MLEVEAFTQTSEASKNIFLKGQAAIKITSCCYSAMAASRLYPTLSRFYEENYVDFGGSESDNSHTRVHEDNLYRKDARPERTNNLNTENSNKKSKTDQQSDNLPSAVYPRLPESTSNIFPNDLEGLQERELCISRQAVPSAPPIDLLDEEFIRFLENAINEQTLCPPLDDTPAADYTILFDDTWVDDLQPDYDITLEDAEADFLNNLNKAELKIPGEKMLDLEHKAGQESNSTELNILSERKRPAVSRQNDFSKHHKVHEKTAINVSPSARRVGHTHIHKDHETESRPAAIEATKTASPSPGSPEYTAWMTWRKQVNRQLATVILLRRDGHVRLQQSDLSRKHLNRKSIDFVSNVVKSGNKTSLGGKPFIMYGIPRACLSGSHAH